MIDTSPMSPTVVKELLQHSPVEPGPIADGLVGWVTKDGHRYCSICVGRLAGRGILSRAVGLSIPVWNKELRCDACGFEYNADRTRKA